MSAYGNHPYSVFGKKYNVMHSAEQYQERGIASWYGTKFHHRKTSSGERYDMLAMTAAHKSLPLPTYVEVTNLSNGRKVIVKVNDRGPFERGRLIDLSYVAAKKLGMLGRGTALVDIRALDLKRPKGSGIFQSIFAKNTHSPQPMMAPIYVQVGAFKYKANAEKLKKNLLAWVSASVRVTQPNHTLYHVQIGPLQSPDALAALNKKLKALGLAERTLV